MWKDNSKKDEKYMLKSMRRLLEARFEPNMKKHTSLEVKKRQKEKQKNWNYRLQQKKDWNRSIKAAKCGKVKTEKRKMYLKL